MKLNITALRDVLKGISNEVRIKNFQSVVNKVKKSYLYFDLFRRASRSTDNKVTSFSHLYLFLFLKLT